MRNNTRALKLGLLFISFFIGVSVLKAQKKQKLLTRDVPLMWVSKANTIERKLWFRFGIYGSGALSKEQILSKFLGSKHPLGVFVPITSFEKLQTDMEAAYPKLITGIKVYISSYDKKYKTPPFPMTKTEDKELVLIFAPTGNKDNSDLGNYYVFSKDDKQFHFLPAEFETDWTTNYLNNIDIVPDGLISTIDLTAPENQVLDKTYSDTKNIWYTYKNFNDFFTSEKIYQNTPTTSNPNKPQITGIVMNFASIPETGIGPNIEKNDASTFKNRLIILFDFTRLNTTSQADEVFYIDDEPDFCTRNKPIFIMGADNGHLCPPGCP